jgi:tRNA (adenine57-N1/adenine58-N1)-methyltransferase
MAGLERGRLVALREQDGRTYLTRLIDTEIKIRGIGRINSWRLLSESKIGESVTIGQKSFLILDPGLCEVRKGMRRRAQVITAKDAGQLISRLGISTGMTVLEAGLGSGGLSIHIAAVLGNSGRLISVENREEHSEIGTHNLAMAKDAYHEFPQHHLLSMDVEQSVEAVAAICGSVDVICLDYAEPWNAIGSLTEILRSGGRLACYCPVTSQLELCWAAAEEAGLEIEWAGELIERTWSRASKGGIRPISGSIGHTAFLLIAFRP